MVLPLTAIICQICYQPVRCHQKFETAHGRSGHGECVDKVQIFGSGEPMTVHLLIDRFLATLDDSCTTKKAKKNIRGLLVIANHVLGKPGGNRLQTSISLENNSKVKQLESKIKVLEKNICMANNEKNLCQTNLQDINMQVVDLESRIDELKKSHAADQSLIQTIVADKALYQNHLNAAKIRIRELEGITDKYIGDVLKCNVEQTTVAEQKLKDEHIKMESELQSSKVRATLLASEVDRLETQLRASKTTQNMVAQREVQALKNALGQYAEKEIAAAAERSQAQTHLHTATNRIGELTTEVAILECKCGRLSEIAKNFEDERDELLKDQKLFNEKINGLNNEIRNLRDSMEFAATDTKAISAERDQLLRERQVFTEHQADESWENNTSVARSQLRTATNRISKLTTELAKRQREHLALEEVAKTFREREDELLKAQEMSNEKINGLNNEIKNLRDSMESATANTNVISSERDQLLQERQVLTERVAQAASGNNTSVADRDLARSQLQTATIRIDKLMAEIANMDRKFVSLREIAKKYRDENVDVRKDNELSHGKINDLNNEIKNLRELAKCTKDILMERNQLLIERQVLPKRQAELNNDIKHLRDSMESATANTNVISSERDQLLQERQVLTERLAQAASANNASVADRDLARSHLQTATIRIDKLMAEIANMDRKFVSLREIAKKYRDENVDVRKDNELSHGKINDLNNEIKNLRELAKCTKDILMERNQLLIERQVFPKRQAELLSENAKMKDDLDQSIKEVANLQLYIDVELRSCVERANEFAAEVEELKLTKERRLSEINELSSKRDCLMNALEIANRCVSKLESEIEECRSSHRNAVDEVKIISSERDKAVDNLYTSAQKVRELAEELNSLKVVNAVSETIEMLQRAIEETEADEKGNIHLKPTTMVNAPAEEVTGQITSDKKSTWIDIELEGFDAKVTRLRRHLQYCYEMIFALQTTCPRLSTLDAVRRNKTATDVILVAVDSVNQMLNKTVDAGVSELVACDDCAPKPAKVARYE